MKKTPRNNNFQLKLDDKKLAIVKPSRGFKLIVTPNHKKFAQMIQGRRSKSLPKTNNISRNISTESSTRDYSRLGRSLIVSTPRQKVRESIRKSSKYKKRIKSRDFTSYKAIKNIGLDLLTSLSKPKTTKINLFETGIGFRDTVSELLKSNKFIRKKFRKSLEYLLKLAKTDNVSLQSFLFHLTKNTLPKHNGISARSVRSSWPVLQNEFNGICQEIQKVLFDMKIKEIRAVTLKSQHQDRLKIRNLVKKRLEKELNKAKPPLDFRGSKLKVLDVLNRLNEKGKKWNEFKYNYNYIEYREKYHMKKYKKDWDLWEQMDMKDFKRKRNRIKMYRVNNKSGGGKSFF